MKNIEKFFVTVALFLLTMTWVLLIAFFATENIRFLDQRAQIYSGIYSGTVVISRPINAIDSASILKQSTTTVSLDSAVKQESLSAPTTIINSTESASQKPMGEFVYPLSSALISSNVEIKFKVFDAATVEFYAKRPESSTEIYLGSASLLTSDTWTYVWDSVSTPNGNYYIIPYVSNSKYGRYAGNAAYISVSNQVQQSTSELAQLKSQISGEESLIQTKETNLAQTQNQISESVSQKTEEISSDASSVLPADKLLEVKQELNVLSLKIKSNIGVLERQALDQSNQEIASKAKEVADLIVSASKDGIKSEEIQRKIGELARDSISRLNDYFLQHQELNQAEKDLASKDTDRDGVPDQEEIRLGTNPFVLDSDGDGFLDGSEIKLGYDPLTPSPADKLTYQNPKEVEASVSDNYQVKEVELVESATNKDEKVLKISGIAPANSFVTIYIYSTPTIVVTKADENGNWEYTLDKPLADGRHTVYASVTNNKGDIEGISKSFDFAKTEDKIIKLLMPADGTTESPAQNLNRIFITMIAITVFLAVVFVILVLGIYLKQHNK